MLCGGCGVVWCGVCVCGGVLVQHFPPRLSWDLIQPGVSLESIQLCPCLCSPGSGVRDLSVAILVFLYEFGDPISGLPAVQQVLLSSKSSPHDFVRERLMLCVWKYIYLITKYIIQG